jgi:hypothetical protein
MFIASHMTDDKPFFDSRDWTRMSVFLIGIALILWDEFAPSHRHPKDDRYS